MGIEFLKDEIDKKIAGGVFDPLTVENKDPKYHYRWLRKEKLNMTRKTDFLGYEVVKAGGQEKTFARDDGTPLKGGETTERNIEVGDLVLARIPKELHEAYRKRNKAKIDALATGVSSSFKSAVGEGAYEEHRAVAGYSGDVSRDDVELEKE
jgi:hypothetical protein